MGDFLNFLSLGYQTEDIDVLDPHTFLCVLGTVVMDENGLPVQDHKYVFSPEVVQRKVRAGAGCYILRKA